MRFVGGKISKNDGGVTVDTPAGALAIRGCIVQGTPYKMSFLFGESMTWKGNNGQTANVYQAGLHAGLDRRHAECQADHHGRHQRHHGRSHQWQQ